MWFLWTLVIAAGASCISVVLMLTVFEVNRRLEKRYARVRTFNETTGFDRGAGVLIGIVPAVVGYAYWTESHLGEVVFWQEATAAVASVAVWSLGILGMLRLIGMIITQLDAKPTSVEQQSE